MKMMIFLSNRGERQEETKKKRKTAMYCWQVSMGVCLDYHHHHQTNVNRQFRVFSSSLVEYQQSLFKKKKERKKLTIQLLAC